MTAEIEQLLHEGLTAHPGLSIDTDTLAQHVLRLWPEGTPQSLHADLVLACACTLGHDAALRRFERQYVPIAAAAIAKVDARPDFVQETVQRLRQRLLVADEDGPPRIAEYAGRGALGGWVRIAAVRSALNALRGGGPNRRDVESVGPLEDVAPSHELRELVARYRDTCNTALRDAIASLTAEQRNLLRLHHVDGLTVDELAPLYGVHRATVARRIARAREDVLEATKRLLEARVGASRREIDSLLGVLVDEFELTMDRLIAPAGG
ncbi:MAG TPA: sigma-70 family RNA polymerase sigma factor [Nannocystaceae bacterium]|nr:sigma-70 family RNA polymerase sigma factor [Nannocystaceae bacterium]